MRRTVAALVAVALVAGGLAACTSGTGTPGEVVDVSGRIAYVEEVDPDGDGDAHFVLLDRAGVTAPGITVVDVSRELRPHPLPGIGDRLSAEGAIRTGSFGQQQVEATQVRAGG